MGGAIPWRLAAGEHLGGQRAPRVIAFRGFRRRAFARLRFATAQIGAQSVTVQAQNAAGPVQQTFSLTVTPDTTPPTVPVLTAGPVTTTSSIPLTWTVSFTIATASG